MMIPGRGNVECETRLFGFSGEKELIRVAATLRYAELMPLPSTIHLASCQYGKQKKTWYKTYGFCGTRFYASRS